MAYFRIQELIEESQRAGKRITQTGLAKAAGISQASMWAIVQGKTKAPNPQILWAIAEVFAEALGREITIDDLIEKQNQEAPITPLNRDDFLELMLDLVLAHQRWHHDSIRPDVSNNERNRANLISHRYSYFAGVLDEIRLGIEEWGYNRSHQNDLNIILRFLRDVNDSTLTGKLQRIIDSLGNPQ